MTVVFCAQHFFGDTEFDRLTKIYEALCLLFLCNRIKLTSVGKYTGEYPVAFQRWKVPLDGFPGKEI